MNYKIYIGNSKCTKCGKSHKKVFEIDGKPYSSSCAKDIIEKDLNAPVWLYEIAENYVQKKIEKKDIEENVDDFEVNFWNELPSGNDTKLGKECDGWYESYVYEKTIKIQGKSVKVDWQYEIIDYLHSRHKEITSK